MLPYGWLIRLNRNRFHYERPSKDPVAYARWEFSEASRLWNRFFSGRISVTEKEVFDLGCGPGGKTCYLVTLGPRRVFGVDYIATLIREAEMASVYLLPPEDSIKLEFAVVDAADLPFPDAYFDLITCSDAFEHFPDPGKVLSEAARVLKYGGKMAIDFAQWGSWNGHHLSDFFKTPWCHLMWSESQIIDAISELTGNEKAKIKDEKDKIILDDLVSRRIEQFKNGLNHISIAEFERLLARENRFKIVWRKRTSAHPILWPLIFIPGLRELFVARNVLILERKVG
ncbi:MAG: methyltransferase domain-containing protein [bacterium]